MNNHEKWELKMSENLSGEKRCEQAFGNTFAKYNREASKK
jgi:hypothetical protein